MSSAEPAPLPQIDAAQAVEVITGFIGSQMAQTGFSRLVVGPVGRGGLGDHGLPGGACRGR